MCASPLRRRRSDDSRTAFPLDRGAITFPRRLTASAYSWRDSENPANLVYYCVLTVGVVGPGGRGSRREDHQNRGGQVRGEALPVTYRGNLQAHGLRDLPTARQ